MNRTSIVAVGVVLLIAVGAPRAVSVRPEITEIMPQSPAPSRTSQAIVVNGKEFAPGLSLSITGPGGAVADYRGNAITELRESSFRVSVMLAETGTYRLVVTNPDGTGSLPFALAVKPPADGPMVREIKPPALRISTSPQTLTVEGGRFDAGLTVSVTDPSGGVQSLGGDSIRNVTPTSFQVIVALETAGRYELTVTNPGGKVSSPFGFDVGR
jgi:hypothetical protein